MGLTYTLPYAINVNGNSNQWLGVTDPDASLSDLVHWQNVAGASTMTIYSNDNDGDMAAVSPAFW